jgi:TatD DNase family protein
MDSFYIDAHGHVQFLAYDADREEVISRAKSQGVKLITVGTQISTSEAAIRLSEQYPEDMWATVGFHPSHLALTEHWHHDQSEQEHPEQEKFEPEKLKELAKNPKVVAIGECGLDYFRINHDREIQKRQAEAFMAQIEIAKELKKPLMIHCRDAFRDLIVILKEHGQGLKPGIVHFFTGTVDDAKELLNLGYYFNFGGVITFARDYDEQIKLIGADRILSETDAPYVSPEPFRGKRNEPAYVVHTVKKLAEILGLSEEKMKNRIWANTLAIFDIY